MRILILLIIIINFVVLQAVTIGTFNIEFFSVSDSRYEKAYTQSDLQHLADTILRSEADVLALQEIADENSISKLTAMLEGWNYYINETDWIQDLAFIWNSNKLRLSGKPKLHMQSEVMKWDNVEKPLFRRPPVSATFFVKGTRINLTILNIHLKSAKVFYGKKTASYVFQNILKRKLQLSAIDKIIRSMNRKNIFIAGDFNCNTGKPANTIYDLYSLKTGFSYDSSGFNLDMIGTYKLDSNFPKKNIQIYEIESSIPGRSSLTREHPDHDLVVISFENQIDSRNQKDLDSGLIRAIISGDIDLSLSLLERGANPDTSDKYGNTALLLSLAHCQDKVVRNLLKLGAKANQADSQGFTPLMLSVITGREKIVRMLVSLGADKNAVNFEGITATDFASKLGHKSILKFLTRKAR